MNKEKIRNTLAKHPRLFKPYIMLSVYKEKISRFKYGTKSPRYFYVDYDRKVIYLLTAKCGCSSIRNSMGYDNETTIPDKKSFDTGRYVKHRLTAAEKDFYIFSFVRNPFDRLVSLYENQYRGNPGRYIDSSRANVYINIYDKGFAYFIWEVLSSTKWNMDIHYKTLYDELYTDGSHRTLIPDYVGRFENLEEDYKVLADRFGFQPLPHLNPSERKDWRDYYTLKMADRVYQKFEKDFHTFGYDECYEDLKKYIKKKHQRSK